MEMRRPLNWSIRPASMPEKPWIQRPPIQVLAQMQTDFTGCMKKRGTPKKNVRKKILSQWQVFSLHLDERPLHLLHDQRYNSALLHIHKPTVRQLKRRTYRKSKRPKGHDRAAVPVSKPGKAFADSFKLKRRILYPAF